MMLEKMDGPGKKDSLPIYAQRTARMLFLQSYCFEEHPVLQSELTLVSMARAKLREELLTKYGQAGLLARRGIIESEIKARIKERLAGLAGGSHLATLVVRASDLTLDDLFVDPN